MDYKKYSEELETIIAAINLPEHTRILVDGAEDGYEYAVDKACEWLQIRMASENTIEQFKQFMK